MSLCHEYRYLWRPEELDLELELRETVSLLAWMLGIECGSCETAVHIFITEPSLQL